MYRFLSFIVIFSFVSVMIYFHNQSGHYSTASHAEIHNHQPIVIPKSHPVPSITGSVTQDPSGTWLLKIQTDHFSFTPEKVGTNDISYNEGHAYFVYNQLTK